MGRQPESCGGDPGGTSPHRDDFRPGSRARRLRFLWFRVMRPNAIASGARARPPTQSHLGDGRSSGDGQSPRSSHAIEKMRWLPTVTTMNLSWPTHRIRGARLASLPAQRNGPRPRRFCSWAGGAIGSRAIRGVWSTRPGPEWPEWVGISCPGLLGLGFAAASAASSCASTLSLSDVWMMHPCSWMCGKSVLGASCVRVAPERRCPAYDRNERDYNALREAAASGRVAAETGL